MSTHATRYTLPALPYPAADHLHDLGITISAGDLDPETLAKVRLYLQVQVQRLVEQTNIEIGEAKVGWHVSYDGSRECGEH